MENRAGRPECGSYCQGGDESGEADGLDDAHSLFVAGVSEKDLDDFLGPDGRAARADVHEADGCEKRRGRRADDEGAPRRLQANGAAAILILPGLLPPRE